MDEAIKNIYEILTKNGKELNIQPVKSSVYHYSDFEETVYSVTNYSQFSLLNSGLVFALGEGESTGGRGGYDTFNFTDIALLELFGNNPVYETRVRLEKNHILQKSILFSKNDGQILVRKDLAGMLDTEEINDSNKMYDFGDKLIINASLEADKIIKYALSRKDIMLEKVKECRNNESPLLKITFLLNLPYDYSIGPLFNVEYFQQIMGNSYAKD